MAAIWNPYGITTVHIKEGTTTTMIVTIIIATIAVVEIATKHIKRVL